MAEKLNNLKKDYSELAKKYNLPSFKQLNEEFDIEKVQEIETETLLREIRKVIMDKILNYLRFVEMFLNPTTAPLFFLSIMKNLDSSDKKILEELYEKLGKMEVKVIAVDNEYSEKSEAEFIRLVFSEWQDVKEGIKKISGSLEKCWDKKCEKKVKSYLG